MNAVVPAEVNEVLDAERRNTHALPNPGQTVIDADTGTITFEHKSRDLLLAEAVAVHTEAKDVSELIDSEPMYVEAGDLLKKITDSFKTLDENRLAATKPLRDKTAEINADYEPAIAKRKEAAELLKTAMLAFTQEVERKRLKAEAEARALAEEERRRQEAEARVARERAEEEARVAREQAEANAAEERRIANENAQRMRTQADELDAAGNVARAAQLRQEANAILGIAEEAAQSALFDGEQAAAAVVAGAEAEAQASAAATRMMTAAAPMFSRPRAAGVTTRKVYSARINDEKALLAHVLANYDALSHLVTIEQAKVNKLASDQKERFNLPGCELVTENAISSRRK